MHRVFFLTIAVNVLSKASNNIFSLFCGRACNFGERGAREKVPGVAGLNEAGPSRRQPVAVKGAPVNTSTTTTHLFLEDDRGPSALWACLGHVRRDARAPRVVATAHRTLGATASSTPAAGRTGLIHGYAACGTVNSPRPRRGGAPP